MSVSSPGKLNETVSGISKAKNEGIGIIFFDKNHLFFV